MITASPATNQLNQIINLGLNPDAATPRWQQLLAQAITDPAELLQILTLDKAWLPAARKAAQIFPLRVPRSFVARMRPGDPQDPLLRQVMPLEAELQTTPGFSLDPVGDLASRSTTGVLQKYHGRALLIATGACAVHCRYCFRRHFPYGDEIASSNSWHTALAALTHDTSITEVILSGGDPLSLSDRRLTELTQGLERITHIKRLRIHSRQPIVLPERVDAALLHWLKNTRLQKVLVLHANHANEIDIAVQQACNALAGCGVTLLNQAVLLAGVNDSVAALSQLSERLMSVGVLPYYLHALDHVQGAAHFEVALPRAQQLMRELSAQLPGYLVPKFVREIPAQASKTPVPF